MPKFDKLLVLDLDETLIFANRKITDRTPDFVTDLGRAFYKRPYLDEFLNYCRHNFELGLWTQSSDGRLEDVAWNLFVGFDLKFKWGRDHCSKDEGGYPIIKDLRKIETELKIPLSKVIVVDDEQEHYTTEGKKNILKFVRPWHGELDDNYLERLPELLDMLGPVHDVRLVLGSAR